MDNLEVSLVKYACPICGKTANEGVLMNTLLTPDKAKAAAELNGKTIGYTDYACKECSKYKDKVVFFIGIDLKKSEKGNYYRTGQIVGVKKHSALVNAVKNYILTLKDKTKYCFIEEEQGKQIGLWD